jgi:peptidyl-prolyl cis-trans isomerase D
VGTEIAGRVYFVAKINKIMPQVVAEAEATKQGREQVSQAWLSAEDQAYYSMLKERFKTDIKMAKPTAKTSSASQ